MRKVLFLIAITAIAVGVVAFFLPGRKGDDTERGEEILPGIRLEFTRSEDGGQYYGKMVRSFLARRRDNRNPGSLTDEEREWFFLGTSCRECSLYPEQFRHIMPGVRMWETMASEAIADIMVREAEELWESDSDRAAQDRLRRVAVFGWHIEQSNESLMMNLAGVKIQYAAYRGLSKFHRARGRRDRAGEYNRHIEAKRKSLAPIGIFYNIANWAHFGEIKSVALTHKDSLWRKEACHSMMSPFVLENPRAQAEALQVLQTVAQRDSDPVVRQFAAACIPYVTGEKT